MPTHFEQSLMRDIDLIRSKIREMSGLCEEALRDALEAFAEGRRQLAYLVILRDQHIDELEKQIDRLCLEFLVRQQPAAGHLRFAYATIKINAELERIGDYAESIARQALQLDRFELHISYEPFEEVAQLAIDMLQQAVRAFVDENAPLARTTMVVEDRIDDLRREIDSNLVRLRQENLIPLEALTPLMTISRRFERVSDQAKSICAEVLYLCTGEYAKHERSEVFRVLFVDQHNCCRSQMAEGIALTLNEPRLVFSSAGLRPQELDPTMVSFMAEKGIDIRQHVPKTIEQVPDLEHYQVIIALDEQARTSIRPRPKTVILDWSGPEPFSAEGSPEQAREHFEATFLYLKAHIQDLVRAILRQA